MQDDHDIIKQVIEGDREVFRVLVERYQASVFCLVSNLLPVTADREDVAQDTFVTAYERLASYDRQRGRFLTWLLSIARNKCINVRQKMNPTPLATLPESADVTTPEGNLSTREWYADLDAALHALPAEQQTAFVLSEMLGLPDGEIARIEDVKLGTIKSRLNRAKSRLRQALEPDRDGVTHE